MHRLYDKLITFPRAQHTENQNLSGGSEVLIHYKPRHASEYRTPQLFHLYRVLERGQHYQPCLVTAATVEALSEVSAPSSFPIL